MSYCRLSECDVYAYESVIGGVQFYIAGGRRDLDRLCMTYNEAYQYMKTLRDQYELDVPDHAIEALKADAIEEALRICGPNSAVSELEAENAKLRELFDITYGYYVSGTLTLCDICGKYDCEGNAPTTCKSDEYDPDGMVVEEIERRMRELGVEP